MSLLVQILECIRTTINVNGSIIPYYYITITFHILMLLPIQLGQILGTIWAIEIRYYSQSILTSCTS